MLAEAGERFSVCNMSVPANHAPGNGAMSRHPVFAAGYPLDVRKRFEAK
ncbi:MAG: hypothetical protein K2N39_03580 [Lachnospiraceae bacterium]|nr:hypothetical protein [Lachnospiraceae bacterium]